MRRLKTKSVSSFQLHRVLERATDGERDKSTPSVSRDKTEVRLGRSFIDLVLVFLFLLCINIINILSGALVL